ncbi:hypothetical protein DN574_30780, partial [Burkholderia multivorans]
MRFQNTPSTSTGKKLDAASENAAPTRNRIFPVLSDATSQRRVTISKVLLLGVALFASYVASLNTGKILFLVGAAFSLA